jgi:signal peptidase II
VSKFLILKKTSSEGIFFINQNNFKFSFKLVKNENLAFSIEMPQFLIFTIIIVLLIILLIFLIKSIKDKNDILTFAFLLIILGAASNLFDRIYHGAVIDFISFNIFKMQLAVFNLADVWIVLGVAILLIKEPFKMKRL